MSKYSEAITQKTGKTEKEIRIENNTCLGNGYCVEKLIANRKGNNIYSVKKEGRFYVAKVYEKKEILEQIAQTIRNIKSEYLMPIIDFGVYNEYYYEIYPVIDYPTLAEIRKFDMEELKCIIKGVNEGLKALHTNGITHGDIKPANIFWCEAEKKIIIGDYESATLEKDGYMVKSNLGTEEYEAPHSATLRTLVKKPPYDYGSLGIMSLDLYNGTIHFRGKTSEDRAKEWENGIIIHESCPPKLVQLIRGLTAYSEENRFGYEQVESWCNGNFVTTGKITRIRVNDVKPTMIFGFDGVTPIKVTSLEELSRCMKQYKDITKQRYFGSVNAFDKLLNYVRQLDEAKAIQMESIVKNHDVDTAIFMIANLLHPTSSLIFQGKYYEDLSELIKAMPIDSVNQEFVNFIKGGALQFFLKNNDGDHVSEIINSLLEDSCGEDEFLYYLVKYSFTSGCESVKIGLDNISTVEELCQHIKEYKFRYLEENHNYEKICAWLYVRGYAKDIKSMKERWDKYE